MAFLAKIKDKAPPEEEAPDMAGVGQTEEAEAPAQPEAEKDAFDALGDIVQEREAPSITGEPAPQAAGPASSAQAGPALDEDEAQLRADKVKAFAKEHHITEEEAERQIASAERAQAAAAGLAGSRRPAEEEAKDEAMEQALRRASGGGGGAVGSLIGGLVSMAKGTAGAVRKAGGKFKVDNSPEARVTRKFNIWYDDYVSNLKAYEKAGSDLKQRREEFNAAFLKTEAAARLRKMADASGQSFDDFMADLNGGRNKSSDALSAAEDAFNDPRARKAWSRIEETEEVARQAKDSMLRNVGKIERNFSDRIDIAREAQLLTAVDEDFMNGMKDPIYEGTPGARKASPAPGHKADAEEQKKFMERMREMSEHIKQMVERLLARLGFGPKA